FMQRGDYKTAISYFERALPLTPNYWTLETNLGVAYAGVRMDGEAERHFLRASALAPQMSDPHFFYGRWLDAVGRIGEAASQLEAAMQVNPFSFDSRHLLMTIYSKQRNWTALDNLARDTQRLAPQDQTAAQYLTEAGSRTGGTETMSVQPVSASPGA